MVGWKNASQGSQVASVRLRCLEPIKVLRARSYPVSLFRERHAANYRVVVFNKVYDEAHFQLAHHLQKRGAKIVFDLCDNHLHNPSEGIQGERRKQHLLRMLELADVVTVPCAELQRRLPVPSRLVRDGVRPLSRREKWQRSIIAKFQGSRLRRHQCNLVWFGNWGGAGRKGGMTDLLPLRATLEALARCYDLSLTIISNNGKVFSQYFANWHMPVYYESWGSDNRLRRNLARFDLCLLPVACDPFTWCKSNNRLALALYLEMPVIADPLPAYQEFAPYCVLGDWDYGLEAIVSHQKVPDVAGGTSLVESAYMTKHAANDWQTLFDELLQN